MTGPAPHTPPAAAAGAAARWARPFRLHLTDGRTWHGAQFPHTGDTDSPDAFVCVYTGEYGGAVIAATSLDALLTDLRPGDPLNGARVERPDTPLH